MIRALSLDELQDVLGDTAETGLGAIDTERGCLPLTDLDVDVQIEGLLAHTRLHQRFANVFADPLEATYIFPLPPRAAVIGFRLTVNGRIVEGRIDERGKARQDYAAAIAAGKSAAIAEEERPNVFTLRVGNIPAHSTAEVELTMIAPLAVDSLEATYRFPLVVAPRYCPGQPYTGKQVGDGVAPDTSLVPDASRISPPVLLPGFKSPVRLGIRVAISSSALGPRQNAAPAHSLGCSLPATEALDERGLLLVTLAPGQRLDRDFVLRWNIGAETATVASLMIEPDADRPQGLGHGGKAVAGDGTFALVVVPPEQSTQPRVPSDVLFLIDRSGSMGGWKMVAARRAVARMIDTLKATDRVALAAFDNTVEHVSETLTLSSATDRHRWELLEWLAKVSSRGGTELSAALAAGLNVFDVQTTQAKSRQDNVPVREQIAVIVTDGQVGDEDRVLQRLAKKLGGVRLYVVGIDSAVNDGLLERMAQTSGGWAELVESEDRLDEVMDRIQSRIRSPLVSDIKLTGQGISILPDSIVPAKMPVLVPGLPIVVRGRYRGTADGTVTVKGKDASGAVWKTTATVTPATVTGLGSLWARGQLRQLEDQYAVPNGATSSEPLERKIVAISTAFGVLCRFTALVAIDPHAPERTSKPVTLRRILQPVEYRRASAAMQAGRLFCMRTASAPEMFGPIGETMMSPPEQPDLATVRRGVEKFLKTFLPLSGDLNDLPPDAISTILRLLPRLFKELAAAGAPPEMVEKLGAAYARLFAWPGERVALQMLVDSLKEVAEIPAAADRWWTRRPDEGDAITP